MKDSKPIKMPSIYDFSARIRPMGEDDLRQVREIDLISFSTPWPERAFRYELKENPNSSSWVAEVDSHHGRRIVVGIIVIWVVQFDAHIATLAVHPDYRLKGIGSQLLGVALHNIVKQGASRVSLEVRAENNVAQNLYQSFGFDIVERQSGFYKDTGDDALLMSVDLEEISYPSSLIRIS